MSKFGKSHSIAFFLINNPTNLPYDFVDKPGGIKIAFTQLNTCGIDN